MRDADEDSDPDSTREVEHDADDGSDRDSSAEVDADGEVEHDGDAYDYPSCRPPPGDVSVRLSIHGVGYGVGELVASCTVESVTEREFSSPIVGEHYGAELSLSCATEADTLSVSLEVGARPAIVVPLDAGDEVSLRYADDDFWMAVCRYLVLRDPTGGLVLAAVDAYHADPPDVPGDDWYGPIGVRVSSGLCPAVEGECCGPLERQGLEVTHQGATATVLEGEAAEVGVESRLHVVVETAHVYHDIRCCVDEPEQYYKALFVSAAGG